ncbi:hypothetical protein D3C72_2580010 [compost metagenome]
MAFPENLQKLIIFYFKRIISDFNNLRMSGCSGAYIFIRRIGYISTLIAGSDTAYAVKSLKECF